MGKTSGKKSSDHEIRPPISNEILMMVVSKELQNNAVTSQSLDCTFILVINHSNEYSLAFVMSQQSSVSFWRRQSSKSHETKALSRKHYREVDDSQVHSSRLT